MNRIFDENKLWGNLNYWVSQTTMTGAMGGKRHVEDFIESEMRRFAIAELEGIKIPFVDRNPFDKKVDRCFTEAWNLCAGKTNNKITEQIKKLRETRLGEREEGK